jgi:hypothetical protein
VPIASENALPFRAKTWGFPMRLRWYCLALLGIALLGAQSRAALIVVPNSLANVEGNSNNGFPFNLQLFGLQAQHYQQVYSHTQFPSGGPFLITAMAFRPDSQTGNAFSSTLSNIRIALSTTSASPDGLSTTYANNIGANNTVVFNGALSLSSANTPGPGNTRNFDIIVTLQTPFLYDPNAGNLLMDVRNFGGGLTTQFDAENTAGDSISRVFNLDNNANGTVGIADTFGLVTQFTLAPVPEPGSLAVFGLVGLAGAALLRRRKVMA